MLQLRLSQARLKSFFDWLRLSSRVIRSQKDFRANLAQYHQQIISYALPRRHSQPRPALIIENSHTWQNIVTDLAFIQLEKLLRRRAPSLFPQDRGYLGGIPLRSCFFLYLRLYGGSLYGMPAVVELRRGSSPCRCRP